MKPWLKYLLRNSSWRITSYFTALKHTVLHRGVQFITAHLETAVAQFQTLATAYRPQLIQTPVEHNVRGQHLSLMPTALKILLHDNADNIPAFLLYGRGLSMPLVLLIMLLAKHVPDSMDNYRFEIISYLRDAYDYVCTTFVPCCTKEQQKVANLVHLTAHPRSSTMAGFMSVI